MKPLYTLFIVVAVSFLIITGCVPTRELKSSQAQVEKLRSDSTATHNSLKDCNTSLGICNTGLKDCNTSLTESNASLADAKKSIADLSDKNAAVNKNYQDLSTNSKMTIDEQSKRLADMQKIIQGQKDIMNKLKKTVSDALVGFTPEELSVQIKNGNIYVSLQEKLLFKSGSAIVDPKGKDALEKLAVVLNKNPDISINIEGHTDSIPIKGKFEDNWALSVARATSIVRILTTDYLVEPRHIIASGRGEYFPVASNSTEAGRARNRRTEIILSPNLTELFKLLNQ